MLVASTTGLNREQGGIVDLTAAQTVSGCTAATERLRPVARPSAAEGCAVGPEGKGTSS
jgi:hypothetical protein